MNPTDEQIRRLKKSLKKIEKSQRNNGINLKDSGDCALMQKIISEASNAVRKPDSKEAKDFESSLIYL